MSADGLDEKWNRWDLMTPKPRTEREAFDAGYEAGMDRAENLEFVNAELRIANNVLEAQIESGRAATEKASGR